MYAKEVEVAVNAKTRECTCEDKRAMAGSIVEVRARAILFIARGAAEAAVAAVVRPAAVARDLTAVHAQRLQPLLQLLIRHAVLLSTCRCIFSITNKSCGGVPLQSLCRVYHHSMPRTQEVRPWTSHCNTCFLTF